jgi:GNAT superfamily N-acetyltransferase
MAIEIRPAGLADVPALVRLVAAMGYAVTAEEVRRRLSQLPPGHAVFVGVGDAQVRGWCHVFRSHSLIVGPRVEIAGLAVDREHQGSGVGGALLRQAEHWALGHGIDIVFLRSGSERVAAHDFYRKRGYRQVKSQVALSRTLPAPAGTLQATGHAERPDGA